MNAYFVKSRTVKPVYIVPTRFDLVLDSLAIILLLLAWPSAAYLYLVDGKHMLCFLFAAVASLNAGIMFFVVRFSDKLRIKMPVALESDKIVCKSLLLLCCIRWMGLFFALQGFFFVWGINCLFSEMLRSYGLLLMLLGSVGILVLMIYTIVYYIKGCSIDSEFKFSQVTQRAFRSIFDFFRRHFASFISHIARCALRRLDAARNKNQTSLTFLLSPFTIFVSFFNSQKHTRKKFKIAST